MYYDNGLIVTFYPLPSPELNIKSLLQVKQVTFNEMGELQNENYKTSKDILMVL